MTRPNVVTCTRCLNDEFIPGIQFDDHGVCNYCALHDELEAQHPLDASADARIAAQVDEIKRAGKGKPYDCVVGVSGGCDSSFLLHKTVELGLRPVAVHFDNTWNSPIATQNIFKVTKKLGVPLHTIVVNNTEYNDIYRSFILSGVKDIEAPTDIGIIGTMYRACDKFKIKYIIEGHSFRTEGISPLGWLYMDGRYIKEIHKRFGTVPMKTFPNLSFANFVRWMVFSQVKRIRMLYDLDYNKDAVKKFLAAEYDWEWYAGHHLENRFTAFYHSYFLPHRVGIDMRIIANSALVRSGQLTREEGFAELAKVPHLDDDILNLVLKRLNFTPEEFDALMKAPVKSYKDFPTYKPLFQRLRWFFYLAYKMDRVPKSFYVKFCCSDYD
jgi:N-acetyl sugar amidotransferase